MFDFWRADKLRAAIDLIIGRILLGQGLCHPGTAGVP
jgi:hypothetical protein